jgi:hypothetical protein
MAEHSDKSTIENQHIGELKRRGSDAATNANPGGYDSGVHMDESPVLENPCFKDTLLKLSDSSRDNNNTQDEVGFQPSRSWSPVRDVTTEGACCHDNKSLSILHGLVGSLQRCSLLHSRER